MDSTGNSNRPRAAVTEALQQTLFGEPASKVFVRTGEVIVDNESPEGYVRTTTTLHVSGGTITFFSDGKPNADPR